MTQLRVGQRWASRVTPRVVVIEDVDEATARGYGNGFIRVRSQRGGTSELRRSTLERYYRLEES